MASASRHSAIVARVIDALERAGCGPKASRGGWVAHCPAHQDRTPSLSVSEGDDDRVLVHCFAGCDVLQVMQVLGVGISELFAPDRRVAGAGTGACSGARRSIPRDKPKPPQDQVHALWARCRPLDQDREGSAWACTRGLDPVTIADRDLCRALPADASVPGWARLGGTPWPEGGYRLVLPLHDPSGRIASLHARNVRLDASPKGALPGGYAAAGLVLAESGGLMLLRAMELNAPLWIAEGAPDFLSCATAWGDAAEDSAPAVLGVLAGSWTPAIAARVPDGAPVVVAVHHDQAGERYLAAIAKSLAGRCELQRWVPQEVAG